MNKRLCETDRNWLNGLIGDPDYAAEVIEWIEQGKPQFEE